MKDALDALVWALDKLAEQPVVKRRMQELEDKKVEDKLWSDEEEEQYRMRHSQ